MSEAQGLIAAPLPWDESQSDTPEEDVPSIQPDSVLKGAKTGKKWPIFDVEKGV